MLLFLDWLSFMSWNPTKMIFSQMSNNKRFHVVNLLFFFSFFPLPSCSHLILMCLYAMRLWYSYKRCDAKFIIMRGSGSVYGIKRFLIINNNKRTNEGLPDTWEMGLDLLHNGCGSVYDIKRLLDISNNKRTSKGPTNTGEMILYLLHNGSRLMWLTSNCQT